VKIAIFWRFTVQFDWGESGLEPRELLSKKFFVLILKFFIVK
jgi:hypothetical protein